MKKISFTDRISILGYAFCASRAFRRWLNAWSMTVVISQLGLFPC